MAAPPGGPPRAPGPPLAYSLAPPPPTGWVPPPYAGDPPPPWAIPPGQTRRSLASIASGIRHYEVVLGLSVALGVVYALTEGLTGRGYLPGLGSSGGLLTETPFLYGNALGTVVLVVIEGVSLASFFVLLLSWAEWRSGLKALQRSGTEYGAGHARDVAVAHRDYGLAVLVFALNVVASVVATVLLAVYAVSTALASSRSGVVSPLPSAAPLEPVFLLSTIVVGGLFNVLLYYFSGRSLVETIRALLPEEERARVEAGRRWMLVGAVLTPIVDVVALSLPLAAIVLVAGAGLVLYGLRTVHGGYGAFLARSAAPLPR